MTSQADPRANRRSVNFPQTINYRPALDGLRGLAVCLVVLFHAEIPGFAGGVVGVAGFVVASVFLLSLIHT